MRLILKYERIIKVNLNSELFIHEIIYQDTVKDVANLDEYK